MGYTCLVWTSNGAVIRCSVWSMVRSAKRHPESMAFHKCTHRPDQPTNGTNRLHNTRSVWWCRSLILCLHSAAGRACRRHSIIDTEHAYHHAPHSLTDTQKPPHHPTSSAQLPTALNDRCCDRLGWSQPAAPASPTPYICTPTFTL